MVLIPSKATKAAVELANEASAKTVVGGLSAGGQIAGGVWLTAIISAVLSQMEYRQKKNELKELYKEELSAQLGKPLDKITADDFDKLATTNHTVGEQLAKAKKERTVGIGVIATATLASVGAAFGIMKLVGAGAVITGSGLAATLLPWLATTAVAMMAYGIIKYPVQKIGEKIFGVDKKTTHERIEEIYKDHAAGKVITRERVFDVFVHANPPLDQFIRQQYGKKFDKLKPVDKLELAEALGGQLGVAQLTDSINQGKIKATELAFTVDGKFSGVAPTLGDQPKHTFKEKMSETVHHAAEKMHHVAEKLAGHHPAEDKPAGFSFAQRETARRAAQTQTQR